MRRARAQAAWSARTRLAFLALALVIGSLATHAAGALSAKPAAPANAPPGAPAASYTCAPLPIALSQASLAGVQPGAVLRDIANGAGSGNFGWLAWTGDHGVPALVAALIPPGTSQDYIDPDDPGDHLVSVGDRVSGRPGVANAKAVRDTLERLKTLDITVPLYDQASGGGATARYRVASFAVVRLLDYRLNGENRITARFLGLRDCTPPAQDRVSVETDEDTPVVVTLSASDVDSAALTFALTTPTHGRLGEPSATQCVSSSRRTTCTATVLYTPNADYNGSDRFTYSARDGTSSSGPTPVEVTIRAVNDPPIAARDDAATRYQTAIALAAGDLLANDRSGPANESNQRLTLTAVDATADSHGTVSFDGTRIVYTPASGFAGTASFAYTVCDDGATRGRPDPRCADGTVEVTVSAQRPPVAHDLEVETDEDVSVDVVLSAADPEGNALTYAIVDAPAHGTLVAARAGGAELRYEPETNFHGTDQFTYSASDGTLTSGPATVTITVWPVQDAPIAREDFADTNEDTPAAITTAELLANDTDSDGDDLRVTDVSAGPHSHGTVDITGGHITYTPEPDFNGAASFAYTIADEHGGTDAGAVQVSVKSVNDPPIITSTPVTSIAVGESYSYDVDATDVDLGDELAYSLTQRPPGMAIDPESGQISWEASVVSDEAALTTAATGLGDAAVANFDDIDASPVEGTYLGRSSIDSGHYDDRGIYISNRNADPLSVAPGGLFWNPTNSLSIARFPFDPAPRPTRDEDDDLTIDLNPGCTAAGFGIIDGTAATGEYADFLDMSGALIARLPLGGSFVGLVSVMRPIARIEIYEHANDGDDTNYDAITCYRGTSVQVVVRVEDLAEQSDTQSFTIDVTQEAHPPLAVDDDLATAGYELVETMTVQVDGTAAISQTVLKEELEYRLRATGRFIIGGPGYADAEYAFDESNNGVIDACHAVSPDLGIGIDDGVIDEVKQPRWGSFNPDHDYSVVFTGRNAPISADYHDCYYGDNSGSLTLEIYAPRPGVDAREDTALTIAPDALLGNDTDPDGDSLALADLSPTSATHGAVARDGSGVVYTPDPDYNGPVTFHYRASDGTLLSNIAEVHLTVAPVNDEPIAATDHVSTEAATLSIAPGTLIANDSAGPADEAGQTLELTDVSSLPTTVGTAALFAGSVVYTPPTGFVGTDTFEYTLCDDGSSAGAPEPLCAKGQVSVTVQAPNRAPVAVDDVMQTLQDTALTIPTQDLIANDFDPDGDELTVTDVHATADTHGTVDLADNRVTYTPDPAYTGRASFAYTISDGHTQTAATVTVTVGGPGPDQEYVLIGGAPLSDNISIDDDLSVFLNGTAIFVDSDGHDNSEFGFGGLSPITFNASPGDLLRIVALDTVGGCRDLSPLMSLRRSFDGFVQHLRGYRRTCGGAGGETFFDETFVIGANAPPHAEGDAVTIDPDVSRVIAAFELLANDGDPEGDPLSLVSVASRPDTHGSVALVDATVTYTPDPGYRGSASFQYTIADGHGNMASATVRVQVGSPHAPVAIDLTATTDEDGATALMLLASDDDGGPLLYTILDAPEHGTLSSPDGDTAARTYTPAADFNGIERFTYQASDGALASDAATVTINVREVNDLPLAATDSRSVFGRTASFPAAELASNDTPGPANETAQTLTITKVTPTDATHGDVTLVLGTISYVAEPGFNGDATFGYEVCDDGTTRDVPDPRCAVGEVTLSVQQAPVPPVADDLSITADEDADADVVLSATDPSGDPLTYAVVDAPAHGAVLPPNSGAAERHYRPDPDYVGEDSFTYRASDGVADSNIATVSVNVREVNDPLVATDDEKSTERDTQLTFPAADLVVNDSKGPDNEAGQTLSVRSVAGGDDAHGTVVMADNQVTYTPNEDFVGDARFDYEVCDDGETAGDPDPRCDSGTVTVTVTAPEGVALAAIEVTPKTVELASGDGRQYTATGRYADDTTRDLSGKVTWSSADEEVATISASGRAQAKIAGTSTIRATFDGVIGETALTVGKPVVTAVVVEPHDALVVNGETQPFAATGIHADGTSEPLSASEVVWSSGDPSVASVSATGVATALAAGEASVTATYGGLVRGSATMRVKPAAANGSLPTVAITAPTDGQTVTEPIEVRGTATDDEFLKYTLAIAPEGDSRFTTIAEADEPVSDGVLGRLDPTMLINDAYVLRLTAYDRGNNSATTEIGVQVDREQKIGAFTMSFDDLTVPLSGIDVTVTRTYDSRDKQVGDFGVGWRLGVRDVRLRERGVVGANWTGTRSGIGLNALYCLSPGRVRDLSATLPGGDVLRFTPSIEVQGNPAPGQPNCARLSPPGQVRIIWKPQPQTHATVQPGDISTTADVLGSFPGGVDLLDPDNGETYDPSRYLVSLRDGTAIDVTDRSAVRSIAEPNGNRITITPAGITHSSGVALPFARDARGRLTSITDPRGNSLRYSYDVNGDLETVTDRDGNVTRMKYDRHHNLLEMIDPLGRRGIRNDYDAANRLVSVTDATGKSIEIDHDLPGDRETITDRRGNRSFVTYDDAGNVLAETDALGHTTAHTYDADGNELTTTDALGNTTTRTFDSYRNIMSEKTPLGHTTSYTYGPYDQIATVTDPLGRVSTNVYDPATGNLRSTMDACGATTNHDYDAAGNLTKTTDPLGHVTASSYDDAGRVLNTTDATGAITSYTYDDNGNKLTQSDPRGNRTSYRYDAQDRLIATTNPDGSTTRTVYDDAGRVTASIDELERVTTRSFNVRGEAVGTGYADGTSTSMAYDANSNPVTSVDQLGRATHTSYDAANRPEVVTNADATTTSTGYDAAGRATSATDERGNTTFTDYDEDGSEIAIRQPLDQTVRYGHDAAGQRTTETDPAGNVTTFAYDCAGRLQTTTFADGTTTRSGYDVAGQRISQTDQAAIVTRFGYDDVGRLARVTDALGGITRYDYDELGNRVAATDAEGRVTSTLYDARGRLVQRRLPLGQTERLKYDRVGNLASRTDFNGRITQYEYDTMHRATIRTPDPSFKAPSTRVEYTATGQRTAVVDAHGRTTYNYDKRDRLLSKSAPQGELTYTYDDAGNLSELRSSSTQGGAWTTYTWDALNRLATVVDPRRDVRLAQYTYNDVGKVSDVAYANGVTTSARYDVLHRLIELSAVGPESTIARYSYDLGPTGERLVVTEADDRRANYTYDDLYRLRSERISGDSDGVNGEVEYSYDKVGNRLTQASTLPGVATVRYAYDFNDRIVGDSYDANGNTLQSGDHSFEYDHDDRLIGVDDGATVLEYDGAGDLVGERTGQRSTSYLVDGRNPTGYSQVVEERQSGEAPRLYTYGADLLTWSRGATDMGFYLHDGGGSVRRIVDQAGVVTDSFAYDAFGVETRARGDSDDAYRYAGERLAGARGVYYMRARYYNSAAGRFMTVDPAEGSPLDPTSRAPYTYASNDPVGRRDPSGRFTLVDVLATTAIQGDLHKRDAQTKVPLAQKAGQRIRVAQQTRCRRSADLPILLEKAITVLAVGAIGVNNPVIYPQALRRTVAVMQGFVALGAGYCVELFAAGEQHDLTPAQRLAAIFVGPAPHGHIGIPILGGNSGHAEEKLLRVIGRGSGRLDVLSVLGKAILRQFFRPIAIAASRGFCTSSPACRLQLAAAGVDVVGDRTGYFR